MSCRVNPPATGITLLATPCTQLTSTQYQTKQQAHLSELNPGPCWAMLGPTQMQTSAFLANKRHNKSTRNPVANHATSTQPRQTRANQQAEEAKAPSSQPLALQGPCHQPVPDKGANQGDEQHNNHLHGRVWEDLAIPCLTEASPCGPRFASAPLRLASCKAKKVSEHSKI